MFAVIIRSSGGVRGRQCVEWRRFSVIRVFVELRKGRFEINLRGS